MLINETVFKCDVCGKIKNMKDFVYGDSQEAVCDECVLDIE
jgi:hypothetical protein